MSAVFFIGRSLWLPLGGSLIAAFAVALVIGRFFVVSVPSVILLVWALRGRGNPDDDVPSLTALVL